MSEESSRHELNDICVWIDFTGVNDNARVQNSPVYVVTTADTIQAITTIVFIGNTTMLSVELHAISAITIFHSISSEYITLIEIPLNVF